MIVLDIETTGLTHDCGIWQIGAIDLDNLKNYFIEECRVDEEDTITEEALKVCGKTREEVLDFSKQSQEQMIKNYFTWLSKKRNRMIAGANVSFDNGMIGAKAIKYGLNKDFSFLNGHRGYDIQTFAQEKYFEVYGKYFLKESGVNGMSLDAVMKFCGIPSERIKINKESQIEKEGKPHDALEDCKLESECFWRLKYGKNLFLEFSKFETPDYLKK